MCFAPQRSALFEHFNFQKCSENGAFVHFDLEMCFVPQRRAIFHLSSGHSAGCFSELAFRPSGATRHWKNTMFRDFSTFSLTYIFFLLTLLFSDLGSSSLLFSSLILVLLLFSSLLFSDLGSSSLLFSSLLFSDCSHLCFFICPYCRRFDF